MSTYLFAFRIVMLLLIVGITPLACKSERANQRGDEDAGTAHPEVSPLPHGPMTPSDERAVNEQGEQRPSTISLGLVSTNGSFVVGGGLTPHQIYDATMTPFNPVGANVLWSYYPTEVVTSLPILKSISPNLNTIRVVIDHRFGWTDPSDAGYATFMDKVKAQNLKAILNLMDYTGGDDQANLVSAASFWLSHKAFLNDPNYKPHLMINIGNEWGGTWNRHQNWRDGVVGGVRKMREGGLDHTIVVDLPGYGQEASIATDATYGPGTVITQLNAIKTGYGDNIVFSWHMYDQFPTSASVTSAMDNLENAVSTMPNVGWIIGETARVHPRSSCPNGYLDGNSTQCVVAFGEIANQARSRTTGKYLGRKWGFLGWSWNFNSANSNPSLQPLDLSTSWTTFSPTTWGSVFKQALDAYNVAPTASPTASPSPQPSSSQAPSPLIFLFFSRR